MGRGKMKKALALSQLLAGLNEGPRGLPHQSILPLNFYLTFSTIKLKNKACPPQFKIQVCRQSIQHSAWLNSSYLQQQLSPRQALDKMRLLT